MYRAIRLIVLAFVFLTACGEGPDRNKGNITPDQANQQSSTDIIMNGSDLFSRYGCFACHSLDGREMYGPPLNDLFMKEISVVRKGKEKTIVADRAYFMKAITDPDYEKVLEYRSKSMPVPVISEDEVETLVDYLIELGEGP